MMNKRNFKFAFILTFSIFLTLGLSISFQSLLADWTPPSDSPPGTNVLAPINSGDDPQTKIGGLVVGGLFEVENNVNVTGFLNSSTSTSFKYCLQGDCITSWPTTGISSIGNANYIQKINSASDKLENSVLYQSALNIGIGTTTPGSKLTIQAEASSVNNVFTVASSTGASVYSIDSSGSTLIGDFGSLDPLVFKTGIGENLLTLSGKNRDIAIVSVDSGSTAKPDFDFFRAEGTLISPAIVSDGTGLGNINFHAYYNNGVKNLFSDRIASIVSTMDGIPSAGSLPTKFEFLTTNGGTVSETTKMVIKNNGYVGIGNPAPSPTEMLDVMGSVNISRGMAYKINGSNIAMASTTLNNYFFGGAGNLTMTGKNNSALGKSALELNIGGEWGAAMGVSALSKNTSGMYNTAFGAQALMENTTADWGTAVGLNALLHNITGDYNTAVGGQALNSNTSGEWNTALGVNTLFFNNTGQFNTALGAQALFNNTSGGWNTAVGTNALYYNTTGSYNTALGLWALYENTQGIHNTAIGISALGANKIGNRLTAIGTNALRSNLNGQNNTAVGAYALQTNDSGNYNTAIGESALYENTIGMGNSALGRGALYYNKNGNSNTAIGNWSLLDNSSGSWNTAVGEGSLQRNLGSYNSALGVGALGNNTTGVYNSALGTNALVLNTTGIWNTSLGAVSLEHNTTGNYNTSLGMGAMRLNSTGSDNAVLGVNALHYNSGTHNVAIGNFAGTYQNGTANPLTGVGASIYIGYNPNGINGESNSIVIGSGAQSHNSNTVTLGNDSIGATYLKGSVNALGVWVHSDLRLKKDIKPLNNSLDKLLEIDGVRFIWKDKKKDQGENIGLIAQNVEKVFPELVKTDKFDGMKSVEYSNLVAPIIEAIKELSQKMDNLLVKFENLFAKYLDQQEQLDSQQRQIDSLRAEIKRISK